MRMSLWSLFLSSTSLMKFKMLASDVRCHRCVFHLNQWNLSYFKSLSEAGLWHTLAPPTANSTGAGMFLNQHILPWADQLSPSSASSEHRKWLWKQWCGSPGKPRAQLGTQFVHSRCIGPSEVHFTEQRTGLMHYALRVAEAPWPGRVGEVLHKEHLMNWLKCQNVIKDKWMELFLQL